MSHLLIYNEKIFHENIYTAIFSIKSLLYIIYIKSARKRLFLRARFILKFTIQNHKHFLYYFIGFFLCIEIEFISIVKIKIDIM